MKKTRTLLCLLLAAVLLVGLCAPSARAEEARGGTLPMCPFDEMEYKRPSVTLLRFHVMGVDLAIKCEQGYKVVEGALDKCYEDYYRFSTQSSIAYIRSCQDTRDSFYAAENAWCDEQSATMSQLMEDMYYICGMSPMAEELEKRYFWEGFAEEYADDSNSIYDDDTVALLEQEAALVAEYRELVASPTIVWQGEEVDYYSFLEEASSYADYWNALMLYYQTYAPKVADVFIRMVKVRQAQAEKMGYDSYEQMQFEYNYERDYTPEQAAQYLADIKTYIVPLFKQLFESGELYAYEDGPLDTGRLEGVLEAGVRSIGGEAEETFDFMKKYGMYDIAYSINKSNMSFQTYLDDYESPFRRDHLLARVWPQPGRLRELQRQRDHRPRGGLFPGAGAADPRPAGRRTERGRDRDAAADQAGRHPEHVCAAGLLCGVRAAGIRRGPRPALGRLAQRPLAPSGQAVRLL